MFFNKLKFFFIITTLLISVSNICFAKQIKVVTITEDFASITTSIGGDLVDVYSLIKGSRNLHDIHPKPSMVMAVRSADLLVRLGMEQDNWIDGLIQVARNNRVFQHKQGYLDASEGILKLEVPDDHIDGKSGDVHKHGNPHYWLNPENGKIIAKHIRDKLKLIDPENHLVYDKNYTVFIQDLDASIKKWKAELAPLSDLRIVTYHKVWPYFFEAFNLKSIGELEPLPGIPPTTKHLSYLKSELASTSDPILILSASFYPDYVGQSFAKDVHAKFRHIPINVGESGISSYLGLFDHIVGEIVR